MGTVQATTCERYEATRVEIEQGEEKKVKRTIDAVDGFWPHRTAAAADAEANVCVHLCWGSRANALEL